MRHQTTTVYEVRHQTDCKTASNSTKGQQAQSREIFTNKEAMCKQLVGLVEEAAGPFMLARNASDADLPQVMAANFFSDTKIS